MLKIYKYTCTKCERNKLYKCLKYKTKTAAMIKKKNNNNTIR